MKHLSALVGTRFRGEDMVKLLATLPQGELLTLKREYGNRYDANAVQVWARGFHIGFIKASQNRDIAMAMDHDIRVLGNSADTYERTGKLAIDGGKQPMVEYEA